MLHWFSANRHFDKLNDHQDFRWLSLSKPIIASLFCSYKTAIVSKHIDLGKSGESIACKYLQEKGHVVLELNFRFDHKEIDIISLDKDILVFTEIKSRSNHLFGFPEEAVTPRKQGFLKTAAEQYCLNQPQYAKIRFDVISLIIQSGNVKEIMHFEDAFY